MVTHFRFDVEIAYDYVWLDSGDDSIVFARLFSARRLHGGWTTPRVSIRRRANHDGDFFVFYRNAPVVNAKAVALLTPLVGDTVEFLPLSCDGRELFVMNVLAIADALDDTKTHFFRSKTGQTSFLNPCVLVDDNVGGLNLFKVRGEPSGLIFASEAFRNAIELSGLRGASFTSGIEPEFKFGTTPSKAIVPSAPLDWECAEPPATDERITLAESRVGFSFPPRLRWMFSNVNGARPLPEDARFESCISLSNEIASAEWMYEYHVLKLGSVPRTWFPFAESGSVIYYVDCASDIPLVYFHRYRLSGAPPIQCTGLSIDQFFGFHSATDASADAGGT